MVEFPGISKKNHVVCNSRSLTFNYRRRPDVMVFTMHDLVHDLARSVMGDELHDASKELQAV